MRGVTGGLPRSAGNFPASPVNAPRAVAEGRHFQKSTRLEGDTGPDRDELFTDLLRGDA
jgi:hypothetical protein